MEILPFFVLSSNILFCFDLIYNSAGEKTECVSKISILRFSSKMSIDGNLNNMSKENI